MKLIPIVSAVGRTVYINPQYVIKLQALINYDSGNLQGYKIYLIDDEVVADRYVYGSIEEIVELINNELEDVDGNVTQQQGTRRKIRVPE